MAAGPDSEPRGGDAPKRVWNSLEVAKLVMSAGTPIAIFAMGFVLTQQSARQNQERERIAKAEAFAREQSEKKATAARAEQIRQETIAREDALRRSEEIRDESVRQAAEARDEAIREAAEARDDALRRDAVRREDSNRRETLRLARVGKLFEKRGELWEQLGPKLSRINATMIADEPHYTNLRREVDESELIWRAYIFYFPDSFNDAVGHYLNTARRFAMQEAIQELDMDSVSPNYEEVLAAARAALDVTGIDAERGPAGAAAPAR